MQFNNYLDTLKTLMHSPSVVGAEHAFFRTLQRELEELGAKVTWYQGLLVAQGNDPMSTLFSAHVDRHGLVCTGPGEFQYAAFVTGNRSDLLGNSISEQLMTKVSERYNDVRLYAYDPWSGTYRGSGTVVTTFVCEKRRNLIFEIDGLDFLIAGTPLAFFDRLQTVNDRLIGQLDNVLTAAMLVHLFRLGFQGTCFFTAQEEAGSSWRFLLEWFRRFGQSTNRLIVLDTSPYSTEQAANEQLVVLREKDANSDFDPETTQRLELLCDQAGISYSYKNRYIEAGNKAEKPSSLGSTEMGRIIAASNALVTGSTLQIPTHGYHTMQESASLDSCKAFLQLLLNITSLRQV